MSRKILLLLYSTKHHDIDTLYSQNDELVYFFDLLARLLPYFFLIHIFQAAHLPTKHHAKKFDFFFFESMLWIIYRKLFGDIYAN